ncbi:inner membrane protein [Klebsiella michiganensis]|uniref:Inner membrane protein n=1 Tax=Klebsiella michiganensis TaxID=1134687 RepID=A0A7H4PFU0_9ENTR|nr:inner membrane protein [Klebsiella michiganensis]
MMSIADIIQLVVLCALLFFPLGYLTRHYQRRIRTTLRLMFFKPVMSNRLACCAGKRHPGKANQRNDQTQNTHRVASALAVLARLIWLELLLSGEVRIAMGRIPQFSSHVKPGVSGLPAGANSAV